jgi:Beta-galactosidase
MRPITAAVGAGLLLSAASPLHQAVEPFVPVGVVVSGVPAEWQLLRDRGFNTLTIELRWAEAEPARGKYQLDWLERTLERAAFVGMRVVIRLDTNAAPAWLLGEYPDGRFASSVADDARPRGCLDHPGIRDAALQFVRGVVETLAQRRAWIGLDVGSQLPLGFCSCPHTQLRYKEWSARFKQTDGAAFVRFARRQDLQSIAQATATRGPRLLISHAGIPSVLQPALNAWPGQDDWNMSQAVDFYGGFVSSREVALAVDGLWSSTRGKGWSMIADRSVPASDARLVAWAAVARGARALTLTEWRDAPAFAGVLTRNPVLFTALRPRPAKVGMVFDQLRGSTTAKVIHQAFLERNVPVDFVHPDDEGTADQRYALVVRVSDRDPKAQAADALVAYSQAGLKPDVRVTGAQGLVETRFLESSNVLMLIGLNHADTPQKVTLMFTPDTQEAIWQNMETGVGVNFIAGPEGPTYNYWFRARDALVLMIRKDVR